MRPIGALIIVAFSLIVLCAYLVACETKVGDNKDDCDKCGPTRVSISIAIIEVCLASSKNLFQCLKYKLFLIVDRLSQWALLLQMH